ncbi:MAG: GAF domain-containing protein, partial [Pseudomonadales bacterium]|nr:GAF domain-containing protein [Pseudomonadales bacterium]
MLDVLRRVIQEVNTARNLETALNIIVERVKEAMGTQVCTVYLLDEDHQRYVFMATRGLNQEAVGQVSLDPSEGLVGLVGQRAEPINLENAPEHPRYHYVKEVGEEPFHSFLGVPIIHHRKVLGVLVVQQQESRRFDESEEAFLITLSAQLAGVIAHARATGALGISESMTDLPAGRFPGMPGAPGVAIGTAVVIYPEAELTSVPERRVSDIDAETAMFQAAVEETREEIRDMGDKLSGRLKPEELALFDAYLHMLDDTALAGEVGELIGQGQWAQSALRKVVESHVA